jgi:hypothetical protein
MRELGSCGSYGVESRYQATTGEDKAEWEDLVRTVVWELTTALYECSANAITNPNPVCSHIYVSMMRVEMQASVVY